MAAFLAAFFVSFPAFGYGGQGFPCGDRADMIGKLESKYGERPIGGGVTAAGGLVQVFTSESGETWSIVVFGPDGKACLIGAGDDWQQLKPPQYGDPT